MDVHPPHEPIHTWRDFFTHLITITIGLFIALMLEAGVEWLHHRRLVHEAEANLRQEMVDNQKELHDALASVPQTDQTIKKDIADLRAIRDKHHPEVHSLSFAFTEPTLKQTAWNTARDTGALSYMPYGTVQSYADLYALQSLVQNLDTELIEADSHAIATILAENDPAKMNPAQAEAALQAAADVQARFYVIRDIARQLDRRYSEQLDKHSNS